LVSEADAAYTLTDVMTTWGTDFSALDAMTTGCCIDDGACSARDLFRLERLDP
jgi:hypothetical protein